MTWEGRKGGRVVRRLGAKIVRWQGWTGGRVVRWQGQGGGRVVR